MGNRIFRSIRFIAAMLVAIMVVSLFNVSNTNAATIESKEITLYYLNDSLKSLVGNIPSTYPQSYQIVPASEASNYYFNYSSYSFDVVNGGVVPAKRNITYVSSSGSTTVQEYSSCTGASLKVYDKSYNLCAELTVNVTDYSSKYCEDELNKVAKQIMADNKTDYDRIEAITKYTATEYDYDYRYSGAYSMFLYGGGDCWASTSMIVTLAHMCGLEAWSRNGNKDPGAGSGHMNALVKAKDTGLIYECEAGYSGQKPRPYYVVSKDSLYSYTYKSSGNGDYELSLYQYDGILTGLKTLEIPSKIGEKNVGYIADSFFHSDEVEKVVLPSTIKTIGNYAFSGCPSLKTFNIPASVTSIGQGVFAQSTALTSLTVDSANKNYVSVDNTIYTKDKTAIIAAPSCKTISLPDTCNTIGAYAFYYNTNITELTVPKSVKTINEGAFCNSGIVKLNLANSSVEEIGPCAFANAPIQNIVIPSTVKTMSENVFGGARTNKYAILAKQAPAIPAQILSNYAETTIYIYKDATGYDVGNWKADNVTFVKVDDPAAALSAALLTPTPTAVPTAAPKPTAVPTKKPASTPTTAPSSDVNKESGVEGFVERLYTVAMNRESDPSGKEYWVKEIKVNGMTGADVALRFLLSDEFLGKNMTNDQFLNVLYKTFFDREGEAGGMKYWKDEMTSGRKTKTDVIYGFINSEEWANICLSYGIRSGTEVKPTITITPNQNIKNFAERLYTTCLNRASEAEGLSYWANELANLRKTGSEVAKGFFFSEELSKSSISDSEFLTRLYKTVMGREPETEGFNYWLGQMKSGTMSRSDVFDGFAASDEWIGICADYGILR